MTVAASTRETFEAGWVRTGDVVIIHQNGDIFVRDRVKEFLKVKGFQVAPAELEGHLLTHASVVDAAVIGIPDEYSGELPLAFVVLSAEAAKEARTDAKAAARVKGNIRKHVEIAKARFKWLHGVEFTDEIPKTPSGKILRRVLREQAKGKIMHKKAML